MSKETAKETQVKHTNTAEMRKTMPCQHHWLFEPAAGRQSKGQCQRCKMRRKALNYVHIEGFVGDQRTQTERVVDAILRENSREQQADRKRVYG